MFRPTYVSQTCQGGDMFLEGNDTEVELCKLGAFHICATVAESTAITLRFRVLWSDWLQ